MLVLGCYAEPHPIYVADGICQYSSLGMDYELLYTITIIFMLTTYQVFYIIHKCCPNAIHLLYTVLLHVMNVLPTHQICTI